MIERKHRTLATIYVAIDAIASAMALLLAYFFRFTVEVIPVTKGQQDLSVYTHILPLVCLVFPLAFAVQGLYRLRPAKTRAEEWIGVGVGTLLGTVILSGLLLWVRPAGEIGYSRATLGLFVILELLTVMGGRSVVRTIVERRYRAGKGLDRVLIAGSGELARAVYHRMRSHRELGFRIVGFVSREPNGALEGLDRLGGLEDAVAIVREQRIEHVFIALPQDCAPEMMSLLDRLVRECVSIHVVPDLVQFMALRSRVEDLDGLPTINLSDVPLDGWSRLVKRLFDIAVAGAVLVLFAPLMALLALLIWIEDRGPIFYRQLRMGLDGIPFEILKFRSMATDAEAASGAIWAEKDDPRRTRVGRLLRGWSLDELPQLWNVLKGEMSLVGPRPERPQFVEQFRAEFPHYMLRHKVRAGMTGWAQVHGWRGNTSIRMRIEHDLYYIENWSLLLDMKILVMTLRHGLRNENAY
ncbi:MAG TPA: undecaprenyl-phosphate glucose phosphotransferase [Thermoanaerobaculia bacterium]|nr:undecaprenyl-phosphate glucose phosphotransferase [Thermoanaerobaculia bacterium]